MEFDLEAYLRRLGLGAVPVTPEGLSALQRAQLTALPFESLDPFLGITPDLRLDRISEKVLARGRGGYCFELNALLGAAMAALGFPVRRVLGRVRKGRPEPGPRTHLAILTEAGGRPWLADAGFGGPAPLAPLALDDEGEQAAPNGRYRLTQDPTTGETVVEQLTPRGWFQLYGFDGAHVTDADIDAANHVCATWPGLPFAGHLMAGGYRGDLRIGLFDRAVTVEGPDGTDKRELRDRADFAALLRDRLGIAAPEAALDRAWARLAGAEAAQKV
jgi:N-hydroxyarylamine O-acetyltransferase